MLLDRPQKELQCTQLTDAELDSLLQRVNEAPDAAKDKWPQELSDFLSVVEAQLKRDNVQNAESRARSVVIALAHSLGGRYRYLPKAAQIRQAYEHLDMYLEWARTGNVAAIVARHPELTDRRIYQILGEQRKLRRATQQQLFGAS
ncbi:hypothetical protein HC761_02385 [bacterium]|nr:hypothetical protein [bacterium]